MAIAKMTMPNSTDLRSMRGLLRFEPRARRGRCSWDIEVHRQGPGRLVTNRLHKVCNGLVTCSYQIEASKIGDPMFLCLKSFYLQYVCVPSGTRFDRTVPAEAGLGSLLAI